MPTTPCPAMPSVDAITALTQLLSITSRSFPRYLSQIDVYRTRQDAEATLVLGDIAADQQVLAERVAHELNQRGRVHTGLQFPLEFTDAHDLALDYLVDRALRYQRQDLEDLDRLSESLDRLPTVKSLVDEARGMAVAHLELLEECSANSSSPR